MEPSLALAPIRPLEDIHIYREDVGGRREVGLMSNCRSEINYQEAKLDHTSPKHCIWNQSLIQQQCLPLHPP